MNKTFDDYKAEVAKLKEELVRLNTECFKLDRENKQYKSTLDEIKECRYLFQGRVRYNPIEIEKAIAKHEGKE